MSKGGANSHGQVQGTHLHRTTRILKALLSFLESGAVDTFKPHPLFGLVWFAVVFVAIIVEAGSLSMAQLSTDLSPEFPPHPAGVTGLNISMRLFSSILFFFVFSLSSPLFPLFSFAVALYP